MLKHVATYIIYRTYTTARVYLEQFVLQRKQLKANSKMKTKIAPNCRKQTLLTVL